MILQGKNLTKSFFHPKLPPHPVLKGIDISVSENDFLSIMGKSGSGKSTLLYILSTLDHPTTGDIFYFGKDLKSYSEKELHHLRNSSMGFVFQFHHLLPELRVLENILLPCMKAGNMVEKTPFAYELLERLGMEQYSQRFPREISGGEQQRVAILRALIQRPKILFADEPTGSLDLQNADKVLNTFKELRKDLGMSIIMVTHDPDYAKMADRMVFLEEGVISHEESFLI